MQRDLLRKQHVPASQGHQLWCNALRVRSHLLPLVIRRVQHAARSLSVYHGHIAFRWRHQAVWRNTCSSKYRSRHSM